MANLRPALRFAMNRLGPTTPSTTRIVARAAVIAILVSCVLPSGGRAGTTYDQSKHGHPETGVQRLPEEGPGACGQCHDEHASRGGVPNGGPFNRLLFTVDDETLCYECHTAASANLVYPNNVTWADSSHAMSPAAYWRGPDPRARTSADAGKCVNCHDPHAAEDSAGVIPSMLRLREEALCLGCHDGVAAKDIRAQAAKAYRHPVTQSRHAAAEANNPSPAQYDDSGVLPRRHAECVDCHNAHVVRADVAPVAAPEASQKLYGVPRIAVTNGAAGGRPTYTWKGADDLTNPREYEVCFKCHSSWTELPPGKPDLATLTNPNNPSYHPIQAPGKNTNIDPAAFVAGWSSASQVYCTDCHSSDDPQVRGPHGSIHQFILRARAPVTPEFQTMAPTDLCFSCHAFEVYGDDRATDATQQASRFNRPAGSGHAVHVGRRGVSCYSCHETHGSTTQPSMIVVGRNPGLTMYTQTAGGGTCASTCHGTKSYTVNYGR